MEQKNFYLKKPEIMNIDTDFKILFACKRGRAHIATEKVCQDFCITEKVSENVFVVAVADGHGGDAYVKSDVGSKKACEVLVSIVKEYLQLENEKFDEALTDPDFKIKLIENWQNEVMNDYKLENPDSDERNYGIIKKYGTTLLFVVVTEKNIIAGQIGDGAILFFNDQNQSQLFRRHDPKIFSTTNSMASSRGIYALLIESYNRMDFKFNNILLSTDGIYDRLDINDSFQIYANNIAAQLRENLPIEKVQPFSLKDTDVSEISSDDCTISAIISKPSNERYEIQDIEKYRFEEVSLYRAYDDVEIYSAVKDDSHLMLRTHNILRPDDNLSKILGDRLHLLQPLDNFKILLGEKQVYAYNISKDLFSVHELIEHDKHLEKIYSDDGDFSNVFWLKLYENITELQGFLASKSYFIEKSFFKTLLVSKDATIYTFEADLTQCINKKDSSDKEFERFKSHFSFLGKIQCGERVLPLFKCSKHSSGQTIPELHKSGDEVLGRVFYNVGQKSYGLVNISKNNWIINDKEVLYNQALRLNKNKKFKILSDNEDTDLEYTINIF